MSIYSIKDLERLTGIKAHTIRIWEKRYNLIEPSRTDTNIRFYDDEDLKKLLNISILNRNGLKISALADMSNQQLAHKILEISSPGMSADSLIEAMVIAMIELNEEKFDKILNDQILVVGFEETMYTLIYPFYEKVGILWQTGIINPAQEHFITNLIRKKIFVAIDAMSKSFPDHAPKIVVFGPEWDLHETGLLIYYYLSLKAGIKVYYLGPMVPYDDLLLVIDQVQPDYLAASFVMPNPSGTISNYLNKLSKAIKDKQLYVSGLQISNSVDALPNNIIKLESAMAFSKLINSTI